MTTRISGGLVRTYSLDIPADPGWSQPARHQADAPGGGTDRDDAPSGGGWQPYGWDAPVTVLPGTTWGPQPTHRGDRSHRGEAGRGEHPRPANFLESLDSVESGDLPGRLQGAAGAAHGGLTATGVSAPWATRPVARRRADGKQVINPGGLALGQVHLHTTDRHRQNLHLNRPSLRLVRENRPTVETSSASPGGRYTSTYNPISRAVTMGPTTVRQRRQQKPFGQTDYVDVDQQPYDSAIYDPGPINGGWVQ